MKKIFRILLAAFLIVILTLDLLKLERVYYIPFDIPGKQAAITMPPFGMFIENDRKENYIVRHEKAHWSQYQKMGLFNFYYTYLTQYVEHDGQNTMPMEVEAKELSKHIK